MVRVYIPAPTRQRCGLGDVVAALCLSLMIPLVGIATTWEAWW